MIYIHTIRKPSGNNICRNEFVTSSKKLLKVKRLQHETGVKFNTTNFKR